MTVTVQPPTSRLPPIAKIATFSSTQLFEALQYLRSLYRPQVRGARRRRSPRDDGDGDDDNIRSDAFERAYAIRWLTALIAQLDTLPPTRSESDPPIDPDSLVQQAASLLATCAGVAAAGKVQRDFTFESTSTPGGNILVSLTDVPLDNHDYASVGAQTWGGACVLAEMIAEHPDQFDLLGCTSLRILELGAGTGLVGLTVAKLLQALPSPSKNANVEIVLTDFYPAVLDNLQSNITLNFPATPDDAISISSYPLDWSSFSAITAADVLSTPFDVVLGADVIYEAQHTAWIHDCLEYLLSYPDGSNKEPTFHLLIPLRPTHTFESRTVEDVFGWKHPVSGGSPRQLAILSKESIFCEAYGDARTCTDNHVEYVYYRIGWTK